MDENRRTLTVLISVLAVNTAGCTVVTINDASGKTLVHRQLGVLEVKLAAACGTSTADINALGLTVTESGTTVGWVKGKQLVVRDVEC